MTNKNDDDDRKDLTRIEDLSEFLHQEDPEIDSKFGTLSSPSLNSPDSSTMLNLDDLESSDETPPEIPFDASIDASSEESDNNFSDNSEPDSSIDFSEHSEIMSEATEEILGLESADSLDEINEFSLEDKTVEEESSLLDSSENFIENLNEEVFNDLENFSEESNENISLSDLDSDSQTVSNLEIPTVITENFEEVKNFAQNFNYGTVEGAGNPPYSVIVRNIKFKEEAEDILALLTEFGIINDTNQKEMEIAINLGSILISQISEYTAIILAHKLRRYDLDLEIGLSDEIHPSKSGESNPKGLTKKSSIKQNKEESFKTPEKKFKISEMIISNASNIPNFKVIKVIGIEHAHTLLNEEDISRMAYINKRILLNDLNEQEKSDFKDYKNEQDEIHNILLSEVKNKAYKEGANALLSVQFNLNSLADHKNNFFKLTCTCTKVILEHE